jgi:hypothetical protein
MINSPYFRCSNTFLRNSSSRPLKPHTVIIVAAYAG